MWNCPVCGEANEDQFEKCWKCVSDELRQAEASGEEQASRPLRSLGSVVMRGLVGFAFATPAVMGFAHLTGTPLAEAAVIGLVIGSACGLAVGCFVWVVFPYQPGHDPWQQPDGEKK
jgi:hypothetical protein